MKTRPLPLIATILLLVGPAAAAQPDDVTANNPLIPPLFSIDPNSPEVTAGLLLPGDLLIVGGDPNLPEIEIPAANLSLFHPADDVDALELEAWVAMDETFVVIFSVDRAAVGGAPPDPIIASLGFLFNVQEQAAKNQAAGDAFMSLLLFDRYGFIPPRTLAPTRSHSSNNTLVVNQGDAGGVDHRLSPANTSPSTPVPPGTPQSNANAGAGTQPSPPPPSPGDSTARRSGYEKIYFSLAAGSPSLQTLPGTGSGADIYVDFLPHAPGGEYLHIDPYMLGLTLDDDIDAMIIFEGGDPSLDQVIFSLAPGSPSLGGIYGPGDLFTSSGFGFFEPYCPPEELGLAFTDNLNMLDFVPCDHILTAVYNWAIGFVGSCEGDINGDGVVNLPDLAILLSFYDRCQPDPRYYPGADFNGDGCIGLSDLATLLARYGTSCP